MQGQEKYISRAEAMGLLRDEDRIVTAMAAAEPRGFFEDLADRVRELQAVRIFCANPGSPYPCFTDDSLAGHVQYAVMFLTASVRGYQGRDLIHYIPQHLSQWVDHLLAREPIRVFWGSCTRPDKRGFVSLGPSCCYELEALKAAELVVLEVNPRLPQTFGATHIPTAWVNHFVDYDHELPTLPRPMIGDTDRQIAARIAELVPDGATLQLGIGSIPNAISEALMTKKDLGVHTEMINDAIMDLFQAGVVTGRRKSLWPGQIVGGFALGTRELYDFIDGNPLVELQPASVVNDPYRIGRNHKMFSINTAVEIDLTGQVCSESVGHRELSGVGGATDTHIGAQRSAGGRGIIALTAEAAKAGRSKIVHELTPGAKVSISRNDVDTVVTEFGVAELKGRSVQERVQAMVAIAHPKYRDELLAQARAAGYL